MNPAIETVTTPRLVGTRITPGHFEEICRLHHDPLVMKTLSVDGLPLSDEVTRAGLELAAEHWQRYRFGLWIFHEKDSGRFVGRGGLKVYQVEHKDVIGLAYAVVSPMFGQGYATEMSEAALRVGFDRLGFEEIDSWALTTNIASQRVMEKLGFRYDRDITFAGLPHRFYRLPASAWRAAGRGSAR
jgi:RimJ/RimL family protein N-acetyltransferase